MNFISDTPLYEGNKKADELGFSEEVKKISEAIRFTEGPFTIGIHGEWGEGKTSFMRGIENYLNEDRTKDSAITTIWFNAWKFEKESHPIMPLISDMIDGLLKIGDDEEKQKITKKLANALKTVFAGLSISAETSGVKVGVSFEEMFKQHNEIKENKKDNYEKYLDESFYYDAFKVLDRITDTINTDIFKFVVFIDDLDRCLPDKAIKILEAVKLLLTQKGFIFIIGVSRSIIEGHLKFRYDKEFGIKNFNGADYLDKIIQLPITIKPDGCDFEKYTDQLLENAQIDIPDELKKLVSNSARNNPRRLIRFINNFQLYRQEHLTKFPLLIVKHLLQFTYSEELKIIEKNANIRSVLFSGDSPNIIINKIKKMFVENINQKANCIYQLLISSDDFQDLIFSEQAKELFFENKHESISGLPKQIALYYPEVDKVLTEKLSNYISEFGVSVKMISSFEDLKESIANIDVFLFFTTGYEPEKNTEAKKIIIEKQKYLKQLVISNKEKELNTKDKITEKIIEYSFFRKDNEDKRQKVIPNLIRI